MLLNKEKKYAFFHLYKCGGNSIRALLSGEEYQCVHSLPIDYKMVDEHTFNTLFKFTIVRNPFDFMLSTYLYCKKFEIHYLYKDIHEKKMSLSDFVSYYMDCRESDKNKPIGVNKLVTFKDYLLDADGNMLLDYVARLESKDDFSELFNKLEIKSELPIVNVNPHRAKDYRNYYDTDAKSKVNRYFAWELDKFEYKF